MSSPNLHLSGPEDAGGFQLSNLIARLGVTPEHPATFRAAPAANLASAWDLWQANWFRPHLAPEFVVISEAAQRFEIDAVVSSDLRLDDILTETLRARSLEAAATFLEGKDEMRANRDWIKFVDQVREGKTPGHVTSLFALQSSLYNLPLVPALTAYAWFEFQSGIRDRNDPPSPGNPVFETILPHVAVAVQQESDEAVSGTGNLRAI